MQISVALTVRGDDKSTTCIIDKGLSIPENENLGENGRKIISQTAAEVWNLFCNENGIPIKYTPIKNAEEKGE